TALMKAGLKNGDLIVAVDGKDKEMTESQFLAHLRLQHGPGDSVKFTVLRGSGRQEVTAPLWWTGRASVLGKRGALFIPSPPLRGRGEKEAQHPPSAPGLIQEGTDNQGKRETP